HTAASGDGPAGKGAGLRGEVRGQEPAHGERGHPGGGRGEPVDRQAGEPASDGGGGVPAAVHQLPQGDHPRPPARRLRLRRRPEGEGQALHDLLRPSDELPAEIPRSVVAEPVPPVGHGQGGARLQEPRRPRASRRHLQGGREGHGRGNPPRGHEERDLLRWRDVRPRGAREVRAELRHPIDRPRARERPGRLALPLLGAAAGLVLWTVVSQTVAPDLPSPAKTWSESRRYVLAPFFKDGEMTQGVGRLAFYSLVRVGKGYLLALAIGTPIGFLLGLSPAF